MRMSRAELKAYMVESWYDLEAIVLTSVIQT